MFLLFFGLDSTVSEFHRFFLFPEDLDYRASEFSDFKFLEDLDCRASEFSDFKLPEDLDCRASEFPDFKLPEDFSFSFGRDSTI